MSAKTFGVLAVVGLVVAFSLSSTLVKRAESPGVLVAFWRMVTVTVVWNLVLLSTGRRVTPQNVRHHIGRASRTSGRLGFLQTEAYQVSSLGRAQCQPATM